MSPGGGLLGVDVVFPVLHGPFGEDGTVQGLLETLDVAYVGAGVAASAVCMDKVLFKELMSATGGVPQVDYVGVREDRWRRCSGEVLAEIAELGLPVFVKPAHLGSSVGIVKVTAAERIGEALDEAFAHDGLVIVEAMAPGSRSSAACSAGRAPNAPPAPGARWRPSPGRSCLRASGTTSRRSTRPGAWS